MTVALCLVLNHAVQRSPRRRLRKNSVMRGSRHGETQKNRPIPPPSLHAEFRVHKSSDHSRLPTDRSQKMTAETPHQAYRENRCRASFRESRTAGAPSAQVTITIDREYDSALCKRNVVHSTSRRQC